TRSRCRTIAGRSTPRAASARNEASKSHSGSRAKQQVRPSRVLTPVAEYVNHVLGDRHPGTGRRRRDARSTSHQKNFGEAEGLGPGFAPKLAAFATAMTATAEAVSATTSSTVRDALVCRSLMTADCARSHAGRGGSYRTFPLSVSRSAEMRTSIESPSVRSKRPDRSRTPTAARESARHAESAAPAESQARCSETGDEKRT